MSIDTHSAEDTRSLGAEIGAAAECGDVILLLGSFGVGKTTLVQGMARGLGVSGAVTSPSFVIANEYVGRIPLYHVDLYRIEQMDQTTLEALAEYFGGDGLCVVEWPGSAPSDLVHDAVRITLEVTGDESRRLTLEAGAPSRLTDAFERAAPLTGRSDIESGAA
ncbi:MAG: tRNA threonylcarbamoyladenosine biosynthesis protein TsaE [Chloroflexi bacterium]|nr:tRNA threonylcarbamoyladenosine biosynthesis protein TsaE [Chloroflexota bacterium]